MSYLPTTAKFKGKTKTYYVIYQQTFKGKARDGSTYTRTQTRVKRVYISGTLVKTQTGTFKSRTGKTVYGVLFVYKNPVKGFIASREGTRYKQPSKYVLVRKVVSVPRNARNIHASAKAPSGPLMDVE